MLSSHEEYRIAGYCRISVDEELDRDNTSIENQKEMIQDFVQQYFPKSDLTFFEDRDRSGYTFEQRESYQKLRAMLFAQKFDILIVKDFSRFSRRNSLGLYELETLRDAGIRIISIGDHVDYPKNDDWLNIQFRFLMNEMPVTDTSKKVKSVVKMRQQKGEWICNAPYGYYIHPLYKNKIFIDEEGAAVVRLIFKLYNQGWGYKKIANYLTEQQYPTALQLMIKQSKERGSDTEKLEKRASPFWSHVSVAKIITNDFYIGTLRQGIWQRKGINKADQRVDPAKHIVFENHHEAIIDKETFQTAQDNYRHRSVSHYKGVRKYNNTYSGYLYCEDCGSPMFAISNPNRPNGYICGTYHKRGRKGCTSHHIAESVIDSHIRSYIHTIRSNLQDALIQLSMTKSEEQAKKANQSLSAFERKLEDCKHQLKESNKQRLKQITRNPDNEELINETFDEIEKDYIHEIRQLELQISCLSQETEKKLKMKQNISYILEAFDTLMQKEHFTKQDIHSILHKITVSNDKTITIELKAKIEDLFSILNHTLS